MTFYNYTSNGSQFSPELRAGQSNVQVFPYPGATVEPITVSTIAEAGQEWQGIYPVVEVDRTPLDNYYSPASPAFVLSFPGNEYQVGATVVKTYQWDSLPLEEIYKRKEREIASYDLTVRYNAIDTSISVAWWVLCTETFRLELYSLSTALNARAIAGLPFPSGPGAPRVSIYNTETQNIRRAQLIAPDGEDRWNTIRDELALRDQETGNATQLVGDALDAAYDNGAGARADVVAIDPRDGSWGYPATIDPGVLRSAVVTLEDAN